MKTYLLAFVLLAAGLLRAGGAAAADEVKIGALGNTGDGPLLIAAERGYFKERGIEVKFEHFASAAAAVAPLSTGELQVVGGGVGPALFNALARGLPVRIVAPRAIDVPGNSVDALMVRPDLRDRVRTMADLKGRKVASNASGSALNYMLAKMLEAERMTLKDIDLVFMPWPEMSTAFANKAIDAGALVDPFVAQYEDKGVAWVFKRASDVLKDPAFQVSVLLYNADWAKKNPRLANEFMVAYVRAMREFHDAMYGGPNRAVVVDILARNTRVKDRPLYDRMHWGHADPNGAISRESLRDQQEWYARNGLVPKKIDVDEIVDERYIRYAVGQLGLHPVRK